MKSRHVKPLIWRYFHCSFTVLWNEHSYLGFFFFYLLDYIPRRTLILENQKKKKKKKKKKLQVSENANRMWQKIVQMLSSWSSNHFKMYKLN